MSMQSGRGCHLAPRKRYTKSKVACRTCRNRKIRCDETKPFCNNCTKTGRICDGVSVLQAEPKGFRFAAPLTLAHFQPSQISSQYSQDELSCLDLFRSRLIYSIVGRDASSKQAWKRLILQAVHEEEALFHAVVAFSALSNVRSHASEIARHGGRGLDEPLDSHTAQDNSFALRHYGKCIEALKNLFIRDDSRCANVALLCALLCICFELQINSPILAQTHLEYSLKVLESSLSSVEDEITMAFARLDLQASTYLGSRPPALNLGRVSSQNFSHESIYQEADDALTMLNGRLFKFLCTTANDYRYKEPVSIPLDVLVEAQDLEAQFRRFHAKYLSRDICSKMDELTKEQMSLLRVKHLAATIILATSLYVEETIYDCFTSEFLTIVDLSTEILNKHQHQDGNFSLDMGIIYPLYIVGMKCRCPVIRRRAIEALRSFPYVEGVWDGAPHAHIAEAIMEIEEEGLDFNVEEWDKTGLVIPEWKRVHAADIYPDAEKRQATVYLRWLPNGIDGGWEDVMVSLSW